MYYWLVNATKRRLIEELRDSFSKNPYFSKIVPFIQDKFAFTERPQYGIIIKGSSGDRTVLSPQNFVGAVHSYCMLANVSTYPGIFLDWIREDTLAIAENGHVFPSTPGIYLLEVTQVAEDFSTGTIQMTKVLSIFDELIATFSGSPVLTATLAQTPLANSVRLYTDSAYYLQDPEDYTLSGKVVTFQQPFQPYTRVYADYKVLDGEVSTHNFNSFEAHNDIIPGVVLAFGNQLKKGDKCAIVVTSDRTPAFHEYGGHYTMSFELDVISRDTTQAEQIADFVVMSLLKKKEYLENDGLTMAEGPTLGGEAEEVYDEEGDEYYYSYSLSMSILTDWAYYKPLPLTVSQIIATSVYSVIVPEPPPDTSLDIEKFF